MAKNETRKHMEAVISGGGSVYYQGRIITQVGQLPSAAEIAKGDPEQEKAVEADLREGLAAMQAQLDQLLKKDGPDQPPSNPPQETPAQRKAREAKEAKEKEEAEAKAKAEAEEEAKRLANGGQH